MNHATTKTDRYLSPRQVARLLCVQNMKVHVWIRTGALKAVDLCTEPGGKPRYKISPAALEEFLRGREVIPRAKPIRRARKPAGQVTQYF